jgi:hypothetical protein
LAIFSNLENFPNGESSSKPIEASKIYADRYLALVMLKNKRKSIFKKHESQFPLSLPTSPATITCHKGLGVQG